MAVLGGGYPLGSAVYRKKYSLKHVNNLVARSYLLGQVRGKGEKEAVLVLEERNRLPRLLSLFGSSYLNNR